MCNLYSITTNQAAIIALFRVVNRYVGNLAPMPGVFPDYKAPIVRNGRRRPRTRHRALGHAVVVQGVDGRHQEARRKAAGPKASRSTSTELLRMEPDGGTTNIRNVKSKHWTRWLDPENRCVVPFN